MRLKRVVAQGDCSCAVIESNASRTFSYVKWYCCVRKTGRSDPSRATPLTGRMPMTRREDECETEAERVFTRASEAEHGVARERDAEREAVSDAEREVVREAALEGINMFDGADDADEDDVPGHRTLESLDDFDIIDDEPDAATARPATARTVKHTRPIQSPVVHHHGVRTNALHMKTEQNSFLHLLTRGTSAFHKG